MSEDLNGGPSQEILENGGNIPDSENKEIIIEAQYKGEDPRAFVIEILESAHKQGVKLTFREVMEQIEAATQETEEEEFSFDKMQTKSAKSIINIPEGITIIIKTKSSKSKEKTEEKREEDDDFDDDEEEEILTQKKIPEEKEEDASILESDVQKLRELFDSEEGRKIDILLLQIQDTGSLLISTLSESVSNIEPPNAINHRLDLFRKLEEANALGAKIEDDLKKQFGVVLKRKVIPTEYIKGYLKKIYIKKNIELPKELRDSGVVSRGTSIDSVLEEKLR
ncbi:MAG: hypothetical protein HQ538_02785 [Parcubacteria group bacterium]|nr:hypothetical protein [Parcubacteria group bacterium]